MNDVLRLLEGGWAVAGWIWWNGEAAPALVVLYQPGQGGAAIHVAPSVATAAGVAGAEDWPQRPHPQIVEVASETDRARAALQAREQLAREGIATLVDANRAAGEGIMGAIEGFLDWVSRGAVQAGATAGKMAGTAVGSFGGAAAGAGASTLQAAAPWWFLPVAGAAGAVLIWRLTK